MILSIILKYWRETLIVLLVIAFAFSVRTCQVRNSDVNVLTHKYDSTYSVAHYYKNKHDQMVAQVNNHELTIRQLRKFGDQLGFDNKALRDQVGTLTRLVGYWKGKAAFRDTVIVTLLDTMYIDKDNVFTKQFKWTNKFLTLDGGLDLQNNQLALMYSYEVEFELTSYRKGKNFFKPGQLVSDITFSDPNMKVREFKGFVIIEPKKKLIETKGFAIGVGFVLGYGLSKL